MDLGIKLDARSAPDFFARYNHDNWRGLKERLTPPSRAILTDMIGAIGFSGFTKISPILLFPKVPLASLPGLKQFEFTLLNREGQFILNAFHLNLPRKYGEKCPFLQLRFNRDLTSIELNPAHDTKIMSYLMDRLKLSPLFRELLKEVGYVTLDRDESAAVFGVIQNHEHRASMLERGRITPVKDRVRSTVSLSPESEMVSVSVAGFGLAYGSGERHLLYTMGIGPCVTLVLHNLKRRIAAMTHFYALTFVSQTLKEILPWLMPDPSTVLEARLIGGMESENPEGSEALIHDIYGELPPGTRIVERDLLQPLSSRQPGGYHILFETRTNELFDVVGVTDYYGPASRFHAGKRIAFCGAPAICDGNNLAGTIVSD